MDERNKKATILIVVGVILVVLGLGVTLLVIKKPFKSKNNDTSENRKVIQLDVPDQTTPEEVKKADAGDEDLPDTADVKDTKEKTSEKSVANNNKKVVTSEKNSEKTSETKKADDTPKIIIESPQDSGSSAPTVTTPTTPAKSDEVIELPFVPYEELVEN
jgi:hypothetical protein